MQLTAHFTAEELHVADGNQRLLYNAKALCAQLLEPVRDHFNAPMNIHCGYRTPQHNKDVGGKPNSHHLFNGGDAAADIDVEGVSLPDLFDWIRLFSHLPFDEVILEHSPKTYRPSCVHLQISGTTPRRWALEGSTGDAHDYVMVEVE